MTRLITRTIMILGLTTSLLTIKPILAHSGHDHGQPEQKSPQIERKNGNKIEDNTKINQQQLPITTGVETKTINVTLEENKQLTFVPQPSELVFLLLVVSPVVLKIIKSKIYQKS